MLIHKIGHGFKFNDYLIITNKVRPEFLVQDFPFVRDME